MTVGAFAVVTLVRDAGGEATHLSRWAGLGKESPLLAGVFAVLPAGVRRHPADQRLHRQVGGLHRGAGRAAPGRWSSSRCCSASVAAFFYVRVIVLMFFSDPVGEGPTVAVPSILTTVVIAVGFAATVRSGHRARARCSTWPPPPESSSGDRLA